jgi:integration host factor subunit beta
LCHQHGIAILNVKLLKQLRNFLMQRLDANLKTNACRLLLHEKSTLISTRRGRHNRSQPRFQPQNRLRSARFSSVFQSRLDSKSSLELQLRRYVVAQWTSKSVRWHLSRETRVVTKKEIVKAISEEIGLTQLQTKDIVQKTFDAIVETLVREKRIELRNFGVFEVKKRAARKARNPRTGERVDVAEKYVVTFKPGKEMEERVRQLEVEAANAAQAAATDGQEEVQDSQNSVQQPAASQNAPYNAFAGGTE